MSGSISPKELDYIGVRFLDPVGKVYRDGDFYYRTIYPEKEAYVKELVNSNAFKKLLDDSLIPKVSIAKINVDGFNLVLQTSAFDWQFKPSNSTTEVLKKAALNWLEINQVLAKDQKGLIDAHHGNMVVNGKVNPMWVDIGSMQPINVTLQGFGEFLNTQLNPLFIFSHKKRLNKLNRLLIDNGGATFKETLSIIGYHHIRYNLILCLLGVGKLLKILKKNPLWYRFFCLKVFKRIIQSVNVNPGRSYWSKYRPAELPEYQSQKQELADPRDVEIRKLVEEIDAKDVVDVGANNGYFLALLAKPEMNLVAVEPDEQALHKFVKWIEELDINSDVNAYACVANFYNCPVRAELVLGLAVTHHIALTDKYKFDFIAKRFAEISTRALVVEFMPNGLNPKQHPDNLPGWYGLDVFIEELNKYFDHVQVVEYDRPANYSPRTLIYCDKKYAN